jgi:RNA polymerase sigma-70 factor (ECF subfamily)
MTSTSAAMVGNDGAVPVDPAGEPIDITHRLPEYSASFDAFYRAAYGGVVAVAHSMTGDRPHGEEIAQEAFIAAHRHWGKVSGLDRPDLWVRRVAINRCTSTFRRKLIEWRSNRTASAGVRTVVDGPTGEAGTVWDAVRRLPDRQRSIVVLHYVDQLSTAEIGDLLGLSASTVQTHLARSRDRLATILEEGDHR